MLALLMLGGLAAIAALIGFVIVAYGRGNQIGKFRAALVQAATAVRAEGRSSRGTVTTGIS